MTGRSFNTEAGWYHGARQAFVPDHGMKAFVFFIGVKGER
jgi:hypothetical protein